MFEWLFPNWSNPAAVTAVVALRLGLDLALVAIVVRTRGSRSRLAILGAALTLLSGVAMVWVLRTGEGRAASFLELGFQVVLFGLAGYATYANPSRRRWLAFLAVAVPVVVLLVPAVVLYGEATVAP